MYPERERSEAAFPIIPVKDPVEAVCELLSHKSESIAIFDYDFTLKTDYLNSLLSLKFGKVPIKSLQILKMLNFAGWHVCILTNQHPKGHIIAREMSHLRGNYPFFPDSFDKAMRNGDPDEELIIGNKSMIYLPFYNFKRTKDALTDVCNFLDRHEENARNGIYMIGDRDGDIKFAEKLNNKITTSGVSVNAFLKFPDPPYIKIIPQKLRGISGRFFP